MSSLTYLVLACLALVQAAPTLKSCGPANYDPTQYTCYNNKDLCPVINGMPTKLCGKACYTPYMYTCTNGNLGLVPPDNHAFTLTASNPTAPFNGKTIEASSGHFYIGQGPATYCPQQVPASTCGAGDKTVLVLGAMDVVVPGGQQYYIQSDGAITFTQAHSAATYNLLSYDTRVYLGGGFFGPNGVDWKACPVAGKAGVWQVFANLASVNFAPNCVGFYAVTHDQPQGTYGAWQYT
ncbi:hypothetical protein LTR66_009822 [Elasticomyces elasticus]|nr:hypothetical protein LTR66_009822 [Elasticomyces elasticus]